MLSVVSTLFDPCGMVAPVTLPAKILVQQLNQMKLGWDDNIPEPVLHEWSRWQAELLLLEKLKIQRHFR